MSVHALNWPMYMYAFLNGINTYSTLQVDSAGGTSLIQTVLSEERERVCCCLRSIRLCSQYSLQQSVMAAGRLIKMTPDIDDQVK